MDPVSIGGGIQGKISGGTVTIGITGEESGNVLPVYIVNRVPQVNAVYIDVNGGAVVGYNDKVRVLAYYSASGVDTSVELVWSNDAFHTPTAQPLPLGLHAIQAVGQDAGGNGDYSGLTTVVTAPLCGASGHVDLYD